MSNALNAAQVSDFLSRNLSIALQVNSYIDMYPISSSLASSFIPDAGFSVVDAVYGNVVVFPSQGVVYYSGDVTGTVASQINSPVYTSPVVTPPGTASAPCDPTTGDLSGFLCGMSGYAKTALTLVGIWILMEAVK